MCIASEDSSAAGYFLLAIRGAAAAQLCLLGSGISGVYMLNTRIQHGEFVLSTNGNILVARLSGSWNEEAARAFDRHFREHAAGLASAPWGHMVLLDDWQLGVPEMGPVIEVLVHWCIDNGLRRAAHVYQPSLLKKLQLEDLVTGSEQGFQRRAFSSVDVALAWLKEEGFELNDELDPLLGADSHQGRS